VFFNFRSSYLFAIGLPYIFSFGSECTLPHSHKCANLCYSALMSHVITIPEPAASELPQDPGRSQGECISLTLKRILFENKISPSYYLMGITLTTREQQGSGFEVELCPFHSPLLWTSHLISFLPLNKMLQFSGFSNVSQDTKIRKTLKYFFGLKKDF
jgi:hypothetical protein